MVRTAPTATARAATANQAAPTAGTSGNTSGEAAGKGSQAGAAQQDFSVVNNTGHVVMTLNVSPSNENEWGPDILGTDTLANGQTAEVSFERGQDQCQWDIRVTYDDGDTGDMRGVNLCEVATVTLTPDLIALPPSAGRATPTLLTGPSLRKKSGGPLICAASGRRQGTLADLPPLRSRQVSYRSASLSHPD